MSDQLLTLQDAALGSRAVIAPHVGFNCFQFEVPCGQETVSLLWSEEGFHSGTRRPSGSGNPILFPFAGRIAGGRFEFAGKRYQLPAADGRGNAIHGFVLNRPWRVVEHTVSQAVGEFRASRDEPALLELWPADFEIRLTYTLSAARLRCDVQIANPDQRPLPFGLGLHPYFCVPLGAAGAADECVVRVPAGRRWDLVDLLPTGNILPLDQPGIAAGLPFGQMQFDDVLTGLTYDQGSATAEIADPASGRMLRVRFSDRFAHCVVYNPPHRQAVCIEPYTAVPDFFSLAAAGHTTGMRLLPPGETFTAWTEFELLQRAAG